MNQTYPYDIQFLNLEGKDANKQKVESYLKKQNPRLLLFHGHGDNKTIFGFKDEILIEMNDNDFLLKDKIVYSLTCDSAKELGINAVKNGTEAFIGYKAPFVIFTDTQREANPAKDHIAESFLSPATKISISLLNGKTAQEALNRSKEDFKKELRRFITGSAIDGADRIAAALLWDMTNQVVLGNKEARI